MSQSPGSTNDPDAPVLIQKIESLAQDALQSADMPRYYANGVISGVGLGDGYLIFQSNGQPAVVVNLSLALLKSLAQTLTTMVATTEERIGQEILTPAQIAERLLADSS